MFCRKKMFNDKYLYFLWNYQLYRFNKANKDPHDRAEIWGKGGIFDFFSWKWKKASWLTLHRAQHLRFWDRCDNGYFVSKMIDITWRFPDVLLD